MATTNNNNLKDFLELSNVNASTIQTLLKKYGNSLEEFSKHSDRWAMLGLTQVEIVEILKCFGNLERAQIDRKSYSVLNANFPASYPNNPDAFYSTYKNEIDSELAKMEETRRRKFYDLAFATYSRCQSVTLYGSLFSIGDGATYMVALLKKASILSELVQKNPNTSSGLFRCADEFFTFLTDISFGDVAKLNVYGGVAIFGLMTAWSFGKHLLEWHRGTIKSAREFWSLVGVDAAANASVGIVSIVGGIAGAATGAAAIKAVSMLLGTFICPGYGTFLGGVIGSFLAGFLAKKYLEPEIRKFLAGNAIDMKQVEYTTCEALYEEALDKLLVHHDTSTHDIKEMRRHYLKVYHPDKQDSFDDNKTKKLIENERYYKVIENYRRAKGTW